MRSTQLCCWLHEFCYRLSRMLASWHSRLQSLFLYGIRSIILLANYIYSVIRSNTMRLYSTTCAVHWAILSNWIRTKFFFWQFRATWCSLYIYILCTKHMYTVAILSNSILPVFYVVSTTCITYPSILVFRSFRVILLIHWCLRRNNILWYTNTSGKLFIF